MIQLGKQEIRARSPWYNPGHPVGGQHAPGIQKCALCGEQFRPQSSEYVYRDGKNWFCRYQHMIDWRKAHKDEPKLKPRKGPQHEKSFGEVSPDGWRTTASGCKARIRYCRDELTKRIHSYENAKVRKDKVMRKRAKDSAAEWRRKLSEAEEMLKTFE